MRFGSSFIVDISIFLVGIIVNEIVTLPASIASVPWKAARLGFSIFTGIFAGPYSAMVLAFQLCIKAPFKGAMTLINYFILLGGVTLLVTLPLLVLAGLQLTIMTSILALETTTGLGSLSTTCLSSILTALSTITSLIWGFLKTLLRGALSPSTSSTMASVSSLSTPKAPSASSIRATLSTVTGGVTLLIRFFIAMGRCIWAGTKEGFRSAKRTYTSAQSSAAVTAQLSEQRPRVSPSKLAQILANVPADKRAEVAAGYAT